MPTGREIVKEIEISSLKAQAQQLAAHVIYLDDQLRSVMENANEAAEDAKGSQDRLRENISLLRVSAATAQENHKMAERELFDALSRIDQLEKALQSTTLAFDGAHHNLSAIANFIAEAGENENPLTTIGKIGEVLCAPVNKLFLEGACSEIISRKSLIVAADATENSATTAEIPTDTAEATIVGATEEIKPPTFLCGKKESCD
jgi:predicted RNase H-like nuclease (RuvC/YqgF family)